jgi:hypothetical protein
LQNKTLESSTLLTIPAKTCDVWSPNQWAPYISGVRISVIWPNPKVKPKIAEIECQNDAQCQGLWKRLKQFINTFRSNYSFV